MRGERRDTARASNPGKRMRRTCDACVKRKQHCEGFAPCARCSRLEITCVFSPVREKERRQGRSRSSKVRAFERGSSVNEQDESQEDAPIPISAEEIERIRELASVKEERRSSSSGSEPERLLSTSSSESPPRVGLTQITPSSIYPTTRSGVEHDFSGSSATARAPIVLNVAPPFHGIAMPKISLGFNNLSSLPPRNRIGSISVQTAEELFSRASYSLRHGLSIFDDLPPLPPQSILNDLICVHFSRVAPVVPIVDRRHFLLNPTIDAILFFGMLSVAAIHHDNLEARTLASSTFFPRLQRLLKADADRPSLSGLQGCIFAMIFTGANLMIESNDIYRSQAVSTIQFLGLHSESFIEGLPASPSQKEIYRRCFWVMFFMDRQSVAIRNHAKMISDEGSHMIRLPCHNRDLDSLESTDYISNGPTISVFFTSTPTFKVGGIALELTIWHLFSRAQDLHTYCESHNVLPFCLPEGALGTRIKMRIAELEEDLAVWKRRFDMAMEDCDFPESTISYLHACYLGVVTSVIFSDVRTHPSSRRPGIWSQPK
ncbi:hypothetical protein M427DRAFT_238702 [Gonapodya prolifera JEL478]|uniref:Zn(2)-C6 fungal-type domain-containing protein n=1 Tax=Gonapodya prolifera (strain JEL478) TaxID=1344416 RepID=A0A138ZYJ0_GONPJ|nr:hypothetical protein M427DRAFT_238702 [Gonapodya prolifera JEL478]|eukprot:KXS09335.1 hypothetical protein M427DRAFT_238702 [Gonapodya prolifera JEL478]